MGLVFAFLLQEFAFDKDGDPIDTALSCLSEENAELTEMKNELEDRVQKLQGRIGSITKEMHESAKKSEAAEKEKDVLHFRRFCSCGLLRLVMLKTVCVWRTQVAGYI